jgi:hypothetical protein
MAKQTQQDRLHKEHKLDRPKPKSELPPVLPRLPRPGR